MTLGERIYTKRKELGLSQETLGNKLNVSRQTVYKWENDQVIPELANLIAMAELFHVKVGWLIAEEELEPANQAYDDVVEKLSELLKQEKKQGDSKEDERRRIRKIGGVILLGVFLIFLGARLLSLENKYQNLEVQVNNNAHYVRNEVTQITSRVQQMLDDFNNITMNSEVELTGFDFENDKAFFRLSAQPKTYVSNMRAVFHVESNGVIEDFEAEEENKRFHADAEAKLSADAVTISVEFVNGEVSESRILSSITGLCERTWPVYDILWPLQAELNSDGTAFESDLCEVVNYGKCYLDNQEEAGALPKILREEVFLAEDGERIADYTRDLSYRDSGRNPGDSAETEGAPIYLYYRRPAGLKLDPAKIYEEHLLVTDEYGRCMEIISSEEGYQTLFYAEE